MFFRRLVAKMGLLAGVRDLQYPSTIVLAVVEDTADRPSSGVYHGRIKARIANASTLTTPLATAESAAGAVGVESIVANEIAAACSGTTCR